jgi:hypothetical protein
MKRTLFSLLFLGTAVAVGFAQSPARQAQIEVTLPNGAHPLLKVDDGGVASIDLPKVGHFGFVVNIKRGDDTKLVVDVLDLARTPAAKLDTVETAIGAPSIPAKTTPQIRVRATYIAPK